MVEYLINLLNILYYKTDNTDTPIEKVYQINDWLGDTLQDRRSIQRAVSNWRMIQWQRQTIF